MITNYFIIFIISFACIALELFFTRILSLKTWNHIVYVIIPFAILGYGIGANFYLIFSRVIGRFGKNKVLALSLSLFAITCLLSTVALIYFPVGVTYILNIFTVQSIVFLLISYSIIMVPFLFVGFIVTYLFSTNITEGHRLYFFDLLGAGIGAGLFSFLIMALGVFRSIILIALIVLFLSLWLYFPRIKASVLILIFSLCAFSSFFIPEIKDYKIDPAKEWAWFPARYDENKFNKRSYETLISSWSALGRTDIFRFLNKEVIEQLHVDTNNFFEIDLHPRPEALAVSADLLSSTPVFKLSPEGLTEHGSQVQLFSQVRETPYLLLKEPKVVVIGAGGGVDLFIAQTHNAKEIIGAEINPGTHQELSPGGRLYDYSGRVYTKGNTRILNVDGRHLVKTLKPKEFDLIVLGLVDSFTGLSIGAYTYAESYLYTKEAFIDYLNILQNDGMVIILRWAFPQYPREDLRLFAIALESLTATGVATPWDHVIVGNHRGQSVTLIKKSPFSIQERRTINVYLERNDTTILYPSFTSGTVEPERTYFDLYAKKFKDKSLEFFEKEYPYDVSVVTDDKPFFYKDSRWKDLFSGQPTFTQHLGTVVFLTQALVLIEAIVFIVLFIILPLFFYKRSSLAGLPARTTFPFILYFSCLGFGFMLIEISLMQRFTLLLGSPINSIAITLAVLLMATGIGSFLLNDWQELFKDKKRTVAVAGAALLIFLMILQWLGPAIIGGGMAFPLPVRIILASVILLPIGICLGVFFPSGLILTGKKYQDTIAWAWGINCGFSVLGSMLAITLAQFFGFNFVLMLASVIYILAVIAFKYLADSLSQK